MALTLQCWGLRSAGPACRPGTIVRRLACWLVFFFWAAILVAGPPAQAGLQQDTTPRVVLDAKELSDPKAIEQRADLYMVRKYYPEAVQLYQRLTGLQPRNPLHYNKLGIAYHQLQELEGAKRAYRKALQLNPRYAEAVNNLAAVEYAQKSYRTAIFTYLKALSLSPHDAVVYSNLGTAYFAYEKFDYAMDSYRYALTLDPNIFQRSGRTGSIVHQRDIKDIAAFNFYMAKTYASLGKVEQTLEYLLKAWEEGFQDLRKELADKTFEPLAQDPRFMEFLAFLDAKEQEKAAAEQATPAVR